MKRILFLCSQNKLRSPTAECIFTDYPGIEVDSAGLNNNAIVPLSDESGSREVLTPDPHTTGRTGP